MEELLFKKCSTCKKTLPITDFWKERKGKYGVRHQCKHCGKKYKQKTKKRNRIVNYARNYNGPKYIEIRFCKDCGKILIHHDIMRERRKKTGLPSKRTGTKLKQYSANEVEWDTKICKDCKAIRKEERRKKQYRLNERRKKRRESIWYCPVCCSAYSINFPDPDKIKGMELEWLEYSPYNFCYSFTCSKECENKIKYALDIPPTGIKGLGKTTFNIMGVNDIHKLTTKHEEFKMALTLKEYTELKKLRIKTKKELKNGTA